MASKPKEVPRHRREKSSSAPSTPRSLSVLHSRRESTTDGEDLLPLPEKPMPHYRRPTLSSAHETSCPTATKQQQRLLVRKTRSIEKLSPSPSSPSSPQKVPRATTSHPQQKEKNITTSEVDTIPKSQRKGQHTGQPQSSPTFPRTNRWKSTVAKVTAKVNPIIRTRSTGKEKMKRGGDQEHSLRDIHPVGEDGGSEEHYEGSGESLAGESPATVRRDKNNMFPEPRRVKVRQGEDVLLVEHEGVKLIKRDGKGRKESPPASNQVIEEAAKLAGKRRNKVAALVGAFETVISLQEPETELSQPQHQQECVEKEATKVVGEVEVDSGDVVMEEVVREDNEVLIEKPGEDIKVLVDKSGDTAYLIDKSEDKAVLIDKYGEDVEGPTDKSEDNAYLIDRSEDNAVLIDKSGEDVEGPTEKSEDNVALIDNAVAVAGPKDEENVQDMEPEAGNGDSVKLEVTETSEESNGNNEAADRAKLQKE